MLRELVSLLHGSDPLRDIYAELIGMVEQSSTMFDAVSDEVLGGGGMSCIKEKLVRLDTDVNRSECSARKKIAAYLVAHPNADVPACLVLMSVVKDTERLGDYCKDILDAAALATRPLSRSQWHEEFQSVFLEIRHLFRELQRALVSLDPVIGGQIMAQEREIGARCVKLVKRVAAGDDPCREGIAWALTARYLKRMAAHISNVASGLVMPIHEIDHYDQERLLEVGVHKA